MTAKALCLLLLAMLFLAVAAAPLSVEAKQTKNNPWVQRQLDGLDHRMPELYHDDHERGQFKSGFVATILNHLVICKRRLDRKRVLLRSCRTAHGGCENRIDQFADYILNASDEYDLNPWMLAAMAYNESRFNPFAEGPAVQSRGILQLNPKTKRGRVSPFAKNGRRAQRFRAKCKKIPGNCQEEIVFKAADHITSSIKLCGGSLALGLSNYNTGRCELRRKYIKNTTRVWRSMQYDGQPEKVRWCGRSKK